MARVGVVVEAQGHRARVSAALRGICGTCSEGACHLHASNATGRSDVVTAENDVGAKPGDTVELDLPGHTELKLSALVWSVPLIGLVGGAVAGSALAGPLGLGEDGGALLGAAAGFGSAILALRALDRRVARSGSLMPHIVRVVDPAACALSGRK